MAYSFSTHTNWADEVAEVSELPEFQTATIRIENPNLVTKEYNEDTGNWTIAGDPVIYPTLEQRVTGYGGLPFGVGTYGGSPVEMHVRPGQARIIPVRWGVQSGGESQANATTIAAIRVQIPRFPGTDIRVNKGFKVFVEYSPDNISLQSRMFTVSNDLQGSSSASRTFECAADVDAAVKP